MDLSKNATKLLKILYRDYRRKIKANQSIPSAKSFGGSPRVHRDLMPKENFEDIDDACRELSRAGFFKCFWADNIAYDGYLTDKAIIFMETKNRRCFLSIIDFIDKFKP